MFPKFIFKGSKKLNLHLSKLTILTECQFILKLICYSMYFLRPKLHNNIIMHVIITKNCISRIKICIFNY